MGEVYRAEDGKLGREVAIKVLPQAFVADPERLARFQREARVLATLNHPHIAGIYEVGEDDEQHFLVMELAEGETLAAQLSRGPIPLEEAIPVALQIAEGLAAAHDRGVIHRDLKPGNLMVDDRGGVKILDFGLAKALEPEGGSPVTVQLTHSPTLTYQPTMAGVLLGTAPYMSPEQARGKAVDRQADVWAFGCVLYEMLTGRPAFPGATVTDALASVVAREPEWAALPDATPRPLHRLLRRCLEKDSDRRLRDLGDARLELLEANENSEVDPAGAAAGKPSRWRFAPWLLVPLAAALGLGLGALWLRAPVGVEAPLVHAAIRLPEGVRLAGWSSPAIALSPDERTLAFVGERVGVQELYLRRLDDPELIRVPGSDGAEGPFFSPDGRWVGFGAGGISGRSSAPRMLKRAPVDGGTTQDVTPLTDYVGGTWGDDGWIYYVDAFQPGALRRVPAEGGDSSPVAVGPEDDPLARTALSWPQYLDGEGKLLVVGEAGPAADRVLVLDLATSRLVDLGLEASFARYAPGGHVLFARRDAILRTVPFDPAEVALTGPARALMPDLAYTAHDVLALAVGGKGSLLYASGFVQGSHRALSRLVRIDPEGTPHSLGFEAEPFLVGPTLAPDDRALAIATWDGSLWVYDLERGTRIELAARLPGGKELLEISPRWSPDGATIAFAAESGQPGIQLYAQSADGTGPLRVLDETTGESWPTGFTPDGGEAIFRRWSPDPAERGVFRVAIAGDREPQRVLETLDPYYDHSVSPDGRWIAYEAETGGRLGVFVAPYPAGRPVTVVSTGGGTSPRWAPDSRDLYYWSDCVLYRVSVKTDPQLRLGAPSSRAEGCGYRGRRRGNYEIAADGSVYLIEVVPDSGVVTALELVLGWTRTLGTAAEP